VPMLIPSHENVRLSLVFASEAVAASSNGVDLGIVTLAGKLVMTGTALSSGVVVKYDNVLIYVTAC
jgi:hypothetical protein